VCWNLALGTEDTPSTRIVLHVDKARDYADGSRKGWALWTGDIATALCMTLYADNIELNTTRSRRLVPFIGVIGRGLVQQCDMSFGYGLSTDNGITYTASVLTKPYVLPQSTILRQFTVMAGLLVAKILAGGAITVRCLRNFGVETTATVEDINLSPVGSETHAIRPLDNLLGSEMYVAQFQFTDSALTPAARWEVDHLAVKAVPGQGS
jgi:hypothetical protein